MEDSWHKCYRQSWGRNRLRPASFAHPAKCSYGLSVRIYEHAIEEGWVKPGDYVVDCFSGVGGFALEAMRHGLNFVGVELEQRFVDMGQGCDCTGISKADWVHFQGRWDKMRYEDGRHWCPECLARVGAVPGKRDFKPVPLPGSKWAAIVKTRQASLFSAAPSASYARNSGKIPCTDAHRYHGNIETWTAQGMPGTAIIVQGDSRRLGEVLARASLCLSSPPFIGSIHEGGHGVDAKKLTGNKAGPSSQALIMDGYGTANGQLAALPEGDHAEACERPQCCIASPPYAHDAEPHGDLRPDDDRPSGRTFIERSYGCQQGQLAALPEGDHAEACERPAIAISSPPFENVVNTKDQKYVEEKRLFGDYGTTPGNIGNEQGTTFWGASRAILEQVYQVLAPGAHAIFVCKRFVRSKKIVEFPTQWAHLCEAVGFKWIHHHKAWLVEDRGAQHTLEGGLEKRVVKRFSFFKRLHSQKYPELEIAWEDVLCFVKEAK